MSLILAAFGGLGISFGRMGLTKTKKAAVVVGGSHPTYYILGF